MCVCEKGWGTLIQSYCETISDVNTQNFSSTVMSILSHLTAGNAEWIETPPSKDMDKKYTILVRQSASRPIFSPAASQIYAGVLYMDCNVHCKIC